MNTTKLGRLDMVANFYSVELVACDHEEEWEQPHPCPWQVFEEANEDLHCVCCNDCQELCYLETT